MKLPSASRFLFTVLILLTWSSQAKGQYDDEYLQPVDDPPHGVEVIPGEFMIRIDENNPINVAVAEIKYTGSPGPIFGNVAGGPSGYPAPKIVITEAGGNHFVEIGTAFDFEAIATAPIYFVTLNPPTPGGGFYIEVVDINDNFPVLNCEGGLEFRIPENEPRDFIHQYNATDTDAIDDRMLRFSLEDLDLPTQPLSLFQIDSVSGVFSLKPGAMLDYEIRTSHRLVISVVDSNPDHKAVCPMTIVIVEDVEDENPATEAPGTNCTEPGIYLVPFPGNCSMYMICSNFELQPAPGMCPDGTLFDPDFGQCNRADLVHCRPVCPISGTVYVPHNRNCSLYWICFGGTPALLSCGQSLYFDRFENECLAAESVMCPYLCPATGVGSFPHYGDCAKYWLCVNGRPGLQTCPEGMVFDPSIGVCNLEENVYCGIRTTLSPAGLLNDNNEGQGDLGLQNMENTLT